MEITRITVGETNCYLLQGQGGTILLDAGPAGAAPAIMVGATSNGIRPEDIKLILITHGHLDHYGDAKAVQQWCGAPIAAHRDAPGASQRARNAVPPAQTVRGSLGGMADNRMESFCLGGVETVVCSSLGLGCLPDGTPCVRVWREATAASRGGISGDCPLDGYLLCIRRRDWLFPANLAGPGQRRPSNPHRADNYTRICTMPILQHRHIHDSGLWRHEPAG